MRSFILNVPLLLLFLTSAKAQRYTFNCSAENITDKSIAVVKFDGKSDTLTFKDGKLSVERPCNAVGQAQLEIDYEGNHQRAHLYYFFLSEGTINLNITDVNGLDKPDVTANKNAVDFEYQLLRPVSEMNVQIKKTGKRLMGAGNIDSAGIKEIRKMLEDQVYECFQIPVKYIKANPGSPVSIEALKFMGKGDPAAKIATADLEVLFGSLSPAIRNSKAGIKYAERLNKMLGK